MTSPEVEGEGRDLRSDLVDLSGIDLSALSELPDTALCEALRRIRREASAGSLLCSLEGFVSSI
ncbi:FxSxx-COOH cyclophane-containing RiPP peptide [Sinosporangium siamense]|uniref:FxSxx-COOH cyclophane-containing RiPP peptide n=1 Tax=Sinosporangium siamense TaxID=1367973 RepID=UPI0019511B03|nr:FxSxx-COOH cyclophane-containing RiPP peptide [Sinosporangium siamense]